jgi:hypothetical protein
LYGAACEYRACAKDRDNLLYNSVLDHSLCSFLFRDQTSCSRRRDGCDVPARLP